MHMTHKQNTKLLYINCTVYSKKNLRCLFLILIYVNIKNTSFFLRYRNKLTFDFKLQNNLVFIF